MERLELKKVALACGLAFGAMGLAQHAAAVNIDLFVSGSTALDPNVEKAIVDMCDLTLADTTRHKYQSPAGSTWTCTLKSGLGHSLTAGTTISMSKEGTGGSANGIGPVLATSSSLARPGTTACGATSIKDLDPTGGVANFTLHPGCANGSPTRPDGGLSDVEPALFGTTSGLSSSSPIGQVFGTPVTDKLYRKLQTAQGISEVSGFAQSNAPTLKSSELRGLFSGSITDWQGIDAGITGAGTGTTSVKICRRGTTSGTQKTFEARLLGTGCMATALGGQLFFSNNTNDDFTGNGTAIGTATSLGNGGFTGFTGVFTVVINNGSGDVDTCLTAADNQDELAIGILGLDRLSGAAGTLGPSSDGDDADGAVDKWHYVKVDGVYPSVANLVNGTWDNLWTQATFNRRPSGYSTDQTNLMDEFVARMGDPANITAVPFNGLAALPSNGYTWNGTDPVVRGERRTVSGAVNNCQGALTIF